MEEEEVPVTPGPDSCEATLKKREYVLRELVDTEEIYVSDLRLICEGYMRHVQASQMVQHIFTSFYIYRFETFLLLLETTRYFAKFCVWLCWSRKQWRMSC